MKNDVDEFLMSEVPFYYLLIGQAHKPADAALLNNSINVLRKPKNLFNLFIE